MKKVLGLSFIGLVILMGMTGCSSLVQKAVYVDTVTEDQRIILAKVEELILQVMILDRSGKLKNGDNLGREELLAQGMLILSSQQDRATVNKLFKARLIGLQNWIAKLQGEKIEALNLVKIIESLTRSEEFLYLYKAISDHSNSEKAKHLLEAANRSYSNKISSLLLMETFFAMGEYDRVAVLIDEMILKFPRFSHAYLIAQRKIAVKLAKAVVSQKERGGEIDRAVLILKGKITLAEIILFLHQETDYLLKFSLDRDEPVKRLFEKLKRAHYFSASASLEQIATRRDAAILFMNIISDQENDLTLKRRYTKMFALGSGMASPVKDVAVEDEAFNAVLLVVEKAVMDLPNGISFKPDDQLKPDNFFNRVEYLMKIY